MASGFQENLSYGLGVNQLTPTQKNLLIFGGLGLAFVIYKSLRVTTPLGHCAASRLCLTEPHPWSGACGRSRVGRFNIQSKAILRLCTQGGGTNCRADLERE